MFISAFLLLINCLKSQQAFIKWAQWASTRPDIFPEDLCSVLASLQSGAPEHSFAFTNRQIQKELGAPINQIFESFSRTPIASGSIAQVYKVCRLANNINVLLICPEFLCCK
jgi:aarF domain-containing kinase